MPVPSGKTGTRWLIIVLAIVSVVSTTGLAVLLLRPTVSPPTPSGVSTTFVPRADATNIDTSDKDPYSAPATPEPASGPLPTAPPLQPAAGALKEKVDRTYGTFTPVSQSGQGSATIDIPVGA